MERPESHSVEDGEISETSAAAPTPLLKENSFSKSFQAQSNWKHNQPQRSNRDDRDNQVYGFAGKPSRDPGYYGWRADSHAAESPNYFAGYHRESDTIPLKFDPMEVIPTGSNQGSSYRHQRDGGFDDRMREEKESWGHGRDTREPNVLQPALSHHSRMGYDAKVFKARLGNSDSLEIKSEREKKAEEHDRRSTQKRLLEHNVDDLMPVPKHGKTNAQGAAEMARDFESSTHRGKEDTGSSQVPAKPADISSRLADHVPTDSSSNVRFTLPTATKLGESGHRFAFPPRTIELGSVAIATSTKSTSALPGVTPNKEEGRRPRAAWGQGLARGKAEEGSTKPAHLDQASQDQLSLDPPSQDQRSDGQSSHLAQEEIPVKVEVIEPDGSVSAAVVEPAQVVVDPIDASLTKSNTNQECVVAVSQAPTSTSNVEAEEVKEVPANGAVKAIVALEVSATEDDAVSVTCSVDSNLKRSKACDLEQEESQKAYSKEMLPTPVDADASGVQATVPAKPDCARPDQDSQQQRSLPVHPRSTAGRGSGRGRGRLSTRDVVKSHGSAGAPGAMDREANTRKHSKGRENLRLLGAIFSKEGDIHRAYNAIVYMLELQKSNTEACHSNSTTRIAHLNNLLQDIKTVQAAAQLSMPKVNEISYAVDLLNQTADNYYMVLKSYREKQYMLELKLKDYCASSKEVDTAPAKSRVASIRIESSTGLLADIQHHNRLRVLEAHFFHTIVHNSPCDESPVATTNDNSALSVLKDRSLPSISSATEKWLEGTVPCEDSKQLESTVVAQNMNEKRDVVANAIRARKLSRKHAWEKLGDSYNHVMHKWRAHVTDLENSEDDAAQKEGPTLRGAAPSSHSMRAASFLDGDRRGSSSCDNPGASSSMRSHQVPMTSMIVRSDYEQERLLNELLIREMRQAKIEKGLIGAPVMRSPWQHADSSKTPFLPEWPSELRTITTSGSSRDRDTESFPSHVPDYNDFLDCTGCRLTTDGKRQLCAGVDSSMPCSINCNCALQVEKLQNINRIWTDMEKSIFVDKFLQFPKNFHRIATFLPNRTTKDCVKFYYDAKSTLEFKHLLKEYDNRRRQVKANWLYSTKAAHFTGGALFPAADSESKEFLTQAPQDDESFMTFANHPPHCTKLLGVPISIAFHPFGLESEDGKRHLTQSYPRSHIVELALRRRLDNVMSGEVSLFTPAPAALVKLRKRKGDSDDEVEDDLYEELLSLHGDRERAAIANSWLSSEPFGSGFHFSFNSKRMVDCLLPLYMFQRTNSVSNRGGGRTFFSELTSEDHGGSAAHINGFHDDLSATMEDYAATQLSVLSVGNPVFTQGASSHESTSMLSRVPGGRRGGVGGGGSGRGRGRLSSISKDLSPVPSANAPMSLPSMDRAPMSGRALGRGRGRGFGFSLDGAHPITPGGGPSTTAPTAPAGSIGQSASIGGSGLGFPVGGRGRGRGRGRGGGSTLLSLGSLGRGRGRLGPRPFLSLAPDQGSGSDGGYPTNAVSLEHSLARSHMKEADMLKSSVEGINVESGAIAHDDVEGAGLEAAVDPDAGAGQV